MNNLFDILLFRAQFQPDVVAIQEATNKMTYRELLSIVKKIAANLRALGIKRGDIVATAFSRKGLEWAFTLAAHHEGAITLSCVGYERALRKNVNYRFLFTDYRNENFNTPQTIYVDTLFLSKIASASDNIQQIAAPAQSDPARIILTSGTTGESKAVALTFRQLIDRCVLYPQYMSERLNYLCAFNISTSPGFQFAVTALLSGTPFFCSVSNEEHVQLLRQFEFDTLMASPIQAAAILREIVDKKIAARPVRELCYAGGLMSKKLLETCEKHLAKTVVNHYGATEVHAISLEKVSSKNYSSTAGYPLPFNRIEIVDEEMKPVAQGEEGAVRVRTPYMVSDYFENPVETAKSFLDGWFYTGDLGFIDAQGRLVLSGRKQDVINRGGVKINPFRIDACLQALHGVDDAAAFSFEMESGEIGIGAAIVANELIDTEEIRQKAMTMLGQLASPEVVFKTDSIPRNQMGKIVRREIAELFAKSSGIGAP